MTGAGRKNLFLQAVKALAGIYFCMVWMKKIHFTVPVPACSISRAGSCP